VKEFLTALLSYPLYSQIWLKFIMDDLPVQPHHKYEKKKPLIGTSIFFMNFVMQPNFAF
jgi:hypothetical protein